MAVDIDDLGRVKQDWERTLRSRNRSPRTIKDYLATVDALRAWLDSKGLSTCAADLTRDELEGYLGDLGAREVQRRPGKKVSAATVAKHYRNLQQLVVFLRVEEIVTEDPFTKMKQPKVAEQPVPLLEPEQIRSLLAACEGPGFDARRDTAIFRLLLDTGARVAELIGMQLDDVDFTSSRTTGWPAGTTRQT